jgi:integrase
MSKYFRVEAPKGFKGQMKRVTVYCKTRNAANELRTDIRRWKRERDNPMYNFVELTDADRNWVGYIKNRIGSLDQLPAVLDHWLATKGASINKTFVKDLRDQFLTMKEGETDNPRTLHDINSRVRMFVHQFGFRTVDSITVQEVRDYLNKLARGYSRRNAYKWLSLAFEFAKEQRMLTENPFEMIDRPEPGRGEPGIITPEEFQKLLTVADEKFPKLVPFLACAGLAGLRTSELVGMYIQDEILQWPDVLFDRQLIVIRGEVAKQTRRVSGDRRFVPMEPALETWLLPHRKAEGPVVEFVESWLRKQLRRLYVAADVQPPDNALRHSFASYWLARTGAEGVGKLAIRMGNSEAITKRHYVESLAPGDGDNWFAIRRGGEIQPAERGIFVSEHPLGATGE